jgi:hypothetical protein
MAALSLSSRYRLKLNAPVVTAHQIARNPLGLVCIEHFDYFRPGKPSIFVDVPTKGTEAVRPRQIG